MYMRHKIARNIFCSMCLKLGIFNFKARDSTYSWNSCTDRSSWQSLCKQNRVNFSQQVAHSGTTELKSDYKREIYHARTPLLCGWKQRMIKICSLHNAPIFSSFELLILSARPKARDPQRVICKNPCSCPLETGRDACFEAVFREKRSVWRLD
jgi:hypothetical protein